MENMEIYWSLMNYVVSIAGMGVTGFLFCRLVTPFLHNRKQGRIVGISYFAVMLVLYFIPWEIDSMFAYAVGIMISTAVMCFLERRNAEQKIFLGAVMYLLNWISNSIAGIPRVMAFHYINALPFASRNPMRQLGCYIIAEACYLVLDFLLMAFFIYFIDKIYVCKSENIKRKELGLIMAAPGSLVLGYAMLHAVSNIYVADTGKYIQDVHPEYEWIRTLYQMVSYLAIIAVIGFYQSIKESHLKEKENAVLSGQIENMKRHIHEIELLYRDIRGLKHDMGNHITVLEHLVAKKEQQEAARYLSELKEQLPKADTEIKSGNPVTDVILTEKKREAREKGIDFLCDFHYPQETKINAFDVSIILNNAVSNAIEATQNCDRPYIYIKSYRKKNAYMIEITNCFCGHLVWNKENGLPESTKKESEHGLGLINIRKVAQKYLGDMDMEQTGDEVRLSIMLMTE